MKFRPSIKRRARSVMDPNSVTDVVNLYLYYNFAQSLLNGGPPLSNFVDRGLGEWEWLGPGSTKINNYNSAHGPPKWALSVVTQHSDVFITETRFTQHGPV
jgi:hypothetical protein